MTSKRRNTTYNNSESDNDSDSDSNNSNANSVSTTSDDEVEVGTSDTRQNNLEDEKNRLVIEVFQKGLMEERNPCVLVTVKKTIRERIFPMIKFVDNDILRTIKLREHNNIIRFMLQDLNRLDDDDVKRAKFWLAYQKEIKTVLTTRKTEVSNQMKDIVLTGRQQISDILYYLNLLLTLMLILFRIKE